jgi:hypothetical protein
MTPAPLEACDIVLKGGVMSGLVYARAVRRLSNRYRFAGIAGSSAGAIAAAFVAAAEYARAGGDSGGFERLEAQCTALPHVLSDFFQATPRFRALMGALVHLAPGTGRARIWAALACFWRPLTLGAAAGALVLLAIYVLLRASPMVAAPGVVLGAVFGAIAWLVADLAALLFIALPRASFGLCSGLAAPGAPAAITDWAHAAIQRIAFGDGDRAEPLTFGDLAGRAVELKIIATDLGHARLEMLPTFSLPVAFEPLSWSRLFPQVVMTSLTAPGANVGDPARLPVIVAVRMSIACPGLLEAVPLRTATGERLLMADGGLARNFPVEAFGAEERTRPVLAFDLATLRSDRPDRITTVAEGLAGHDRPARLDGLRDYAWALIVALREAATRATLLEPAHRDTTFQVWLAATEGGMSLDMTPAEAERLMAYGDDLASHVLQRQNTLLDAAIEGTQP